MQNSEARKVAAVRAGGDRVARRPGFKPGHWLARRYDSDVALATHLSGVIEHQRAWHRQRSDAASSAASPAILVIQRHRQASSSKMKDLRRHVILSFLRFSAANAVITTFRGKMKTQTVKSIRVTFKTPEVGRISGSGRPVMGQRAKPTPTPRYICRISASQPSRLYSVNQCMKICMENIFLNISIKKQLASEENNQWLFAKRLKQV